MGLMLQISSLSASAAETGASEQSHTLDSLSESARTVDGIWANDVEPGDRLVVRTQNSVYFLTALADGLFRVSGGWFSAQGLEELDLRIAGCTWGGHAILTGLVAAPGMCIEFDNTVQTTSVREVRLFRQPVSDTQH
jgi:hypothetical protein